MRDKRHKFYCIRCTAELGRVGLDSYERMSAQFDCKSCKTQSILWFDENDVRGVVGSISVDVYSGGEKFFELHCPFCGKVAGFGENKLKDVSDKQELPEAMRVNTVGMRCVNPGCKRLFYVEFSAKPLEIDFREFLGKDVPSRREYDTGVPD